ncbi:MAG: ABC transporter permease [Sediminibacterium sp.]
MKKIVKYIMTDILRSRIVLVYTLVLLITSLSLFGLEDNANKGLLSLLNIILIIVPLFSLLFATIYIYNSTEFIELLVSQPLQRKTIWLSFSLGLAISLSLAFFMGIGIPVLFFQFNVIGFLLVLVGMLLSIIFVSIALWVAVQIRDKAKGIGMAILVWIYFSLLFDGFVLFLLFQFADYPLEKPMLVVSALNPIDLGRILILLQLDISAMMGYTGAIFKDFFGTIFGITIAITTLLVWIITPLYFSTRKFNGKDL